MITKTIKILRARLGLKAWDVSARIFETRTDVAGQALARAFRDEKLRERCVEVDQEMYLCPLTGERFKHNYRIMTAFQEEFKAVVQREANKIVRERGPSPLDTALANAFRAAFSENNSQNLNN